MSCIKLLNSLELVNKRVINSFIADSLKRAIKSDVMLDQTKNHSPLLKLGILHDLNIRESFMPSEATQQTWEQLKRQIYRTLFHRIVSFDTRQTLQQILETAKSPNLESSGSLATLTMPCLVNSERVFQEIKGYTDVMERTAVKKNASGGFFDLQKMFDKDVISFQDPEERVILAADIDSDKLTEIKEAEGSTDSADELDGEESEAAEIKKREDQHGEIIEMIRAININTHNVYSPIRNQHTCNIYFKYRNLANYFSLCATLICDSPKSIAKT